MWYIVEAIESPVLFIGKTPRDNLCSGGPSVQPNMHTNELNNIEGAAPISLMQGFLEQAQTPPKEGGLRKGFIHRSYVFDVGGNQRSKSRVFFLFCCFWSQFLPKVSLNFPDVLANCLPCRIVLD